MCDVETVRAPHPTWLVVRTASGVRYRRNAAGGWCDVWSEEVFERHPDVNIDGTPHVGASWEQVARDGPVTVLRRDVSWRIGQVRGDSVFRGAWAVSRLVPFNNHFDGTRRLRWCVARHLRTHAEAVDWLVTNRSLLDGTRPSHVRYDDRDRGGV